MNNKPILPILSFILGIASFGSLIQTGIPAIIIGIIHLKRKTRHLDIFAQGGIVLGGLSSFLAVLTTIASIFCSEGDCKNSVVPNHSSNYAPSLPQSPKNTLPKGCTIISEKPNDYLGALVMLIRLDKKCSEAELIRISYEIRKCRMKYNSFRIFYYLPEDIPEVNIAWATSKFNPDHINTIINGSTLEDDNIMGNRSTSLTGAVLGQWKDSDRSIIFSLVAKEDDTLFMNFIYHDGSSAEYRVVSKQTNIGKRVDYINSLHGEYFIIESNGNLGLYSNTGKFAEAKKCN